MVTLHTSPYLHLPHLTTARPLVKCNETCGWVVVGGWVATNFSVSSRQGFKEGFQAFRLKGHTLANLADPCLTHPLPILANPCLTLA